MRNVCFHFVSILIFNRSILKMDIKYDVTINKMTIKIRQYFQLYLSLPQYAQNVTILKFIASAEFGSKSNAKTKYL